jgi:hypothetical protein
VGNIAQVFDGALSVERNLDADAPELLPVHLAWAAAKVLGVDGAGVAVHGDEERRIPLGASDETVAAAVVGAPG